MTRTNAYTTATFLAALLSMSAALVPALALARPVLSPLLVVLLPGLAIVRLLMRDGSLAATLPLASGLSLAITVLVGLLLDLAGAMSTVAWAFTLGGVAMLACGLRALMGSAPPPQVAARKRSAARASGQAVLFALSAVVALAAIGLARQGALAQREYAFTEFWMAPRQPLEQNVVAIGVRNAEKARTAYKVVMVADDAMLGRWPDIELDPGATWTTQISLNAQLRHSRRVEAWLYRAERPDEVYRKVWLSASPH